MGVLDPFRPKWKHSDVDVRMAAVQELEDPEILCKVIIGDSGWFVRHSAFARLRDLKPDQKWYRLVAEKSKDEEVRRKVVKVMQNEADIEWVAKNDQYRYVRDAAEHRLDELRKNTWGERPPAGEAPSEPAAPSA